MVTKSGENLLFEKDSYIIRGLCFKLYQKFGGAFKESIINKALIYELKSKGLKVEDQKRIDIIYRGEKLGTYVPDIIVEDKILIELKVKPRLTKIDERQFWYYLRGANYKLGFLINFGSNKLDIKRRIYDKARNNILVRVNPRVNPRLSASIKRGFTLIEMLVAVTVFSLVIGSTTGLFISAIRSQSKVLVSQKLLDETSFVMEYMSRALRMAQKDLVPIPTCLSVSGLNYENPGGVDSRIKFIRNIEGTDVCQEFRLESDQLKEYRDSSILGELTSSKLEITPTSLRFNLSGESQADNLQPRVTISMTIRKAGAAKPEIKIQTTISQRNLDIQLPPLTFTSISFTCTFSNEVRADLSWIAGAGQDKVWVDIGADGSFPPELIFSISGTQTTLAVGDPPSIPLPENTPIRFTVLDLTPGPVGIIADSTVTSPNCP